MSPFGNTDKSRPHGRIDQVREILKECTLALLRRPEPPRATLRLIDLAKLLQLGRQNKVSAICRFFERGCAGSNWQQWASLEDTSQAQILAVSKDFFDCSDLYRHSLGSWLNRREYAAYRRLHGLEGIPQNVGLLRSDIFVMDYINGRDLKEVAPGELPRVALQQLENILREIHKRRVVHFDIGHDSNGDYGRETNLLWDGSQLHLIDFAGALLGLPPGLFELCASHDRLALTKMKAKFFPELLTAQEMPSPKICKLFKKLGKL